MHDHSSQFQLEDALPHLRLHPSREHDVPPLTAQSVCQLGDIHAEDGGEGGCGGFGVRHEDRVGPDGRHAPAHGQLLTVPVVDHSTLGRDGELTDVLALG